LFNPVFLRLYILLTQLKNQILVHIMKANIHITGDGSHTLFVPALNEFYHSAKGAFSESMHVFINLGFYSVANSAIINILEVGFGTGLNCLLTFIEAREKKNKIFYDALEPFPLQWDLVSKLNYSSIISFRDSEKWMEKIHRCDTCRWINLTDRFSIRKRVMKIEEAELQAENYDLVYYDAFGPNAQPEMWKLYNFKKIFYSLKRGGILVTYCAKGQVRRDLQSAGFFVERLPGPPGKREVLRAKKKVK